MVRERQIVHCTGAGKLYTLYALRPETSSMRCVAVISERKRGMKLFLAVARFDVKSGDVTH